VRLDFVLAPGKLPAKWSSADAGHEDSFLG